MGLSPQQIVQRYEGKKGYESIVSSAKSIINQETSIRSIENNSVQQSRLRQLAVRKRALGTQLQDRSRLISYSRGTYNPEGRSTYLRAAKEATGKKTAVQRGQRVFKTNLNRAEQARTGTFVQGPAPSFGPRKTFGSRTVSQPVLIGQSREVIEPTKLEQRPYIDSAYSNIDGLTSPKSKIWKDGVVQTPDVYDVEGYKTKLTAKRRKDYLAESGKYSGLFEEVRKQEAWDKKTSDIVKKTESFISEKTGLKTDKNLDYKTRETDVVTPVKTVDAAGKVVKTDLVSQTVTERVKRDRKFSDIASVDYLSGLAVKGTAMIVTLPVTLPRTAVSIGKKIGITAGAIQLSPETRSFAKTELVRAGKETPGAIGRSYDIRKPEGLVNLGLTVAAVKTMGAARSQSRALTPAKGSKISISKQSVKVDTRRTVSGQKIGTIERVAGKKGSLVGTEKGMFISKTGKQVKYTATSRLPISGRGKGTYQVKYKSSQGQLLGKQSGSLKHDFGVAKSSQSTYKYYVDTKYAKSGSIQKRTLYETGKGTIPAKRVSMQVKKPQVVKIGEFKAVVTRPTGGESQTLKYINIKGGKQLVNGKLYEFSKVAKVKQQGQQVYYGKVLQDVKYKGFFKSYAAKNKLKQPVTLERKGFENIGIDKSNWPKFLKSKKASVAISRSDVGGPILPRSSQVFTQPKSSITGIIESTKVSTGTSSIIGKLKLKPDVGLILSKPMTDGIGLLPPMARVDSGVKGSFKSQVIPMQQTIIGSSPIQKITPSTITRPSTITQPRTYTVPISSTVTKPVSSIITKTTPIVGDPTPPPNNLPPLGGPSPPFIPALGLALPFGGGSSGSKGRKRKKKAKFAPKYFASLEAVVFNIKGKKPGKDSLRTGLNVRPIVK